RTSPRSAARTARSPHEQSTGDQRGDWLRPASSREQNSPSSRAKSPDTARWIRHALPANSEGGWVRFAFILLLEAKVAFTSASPELVAALKSLPGRVDPSP